MNTNITFPHSHQDVFFNTSPYPSSKPRKEGLLKVSDLHSIYYSLYGNPNGIPLVVLHGGPGGGCSDVMTESFDLTKWNVVMFDQRGAMRSEPFGCMEENTSQDLVEDIEKLRKHLKIDKWVVFGGSWGSCLALLYGQTHPKSCIAFILRGVFLAREADYKHLFYEMGKIFPEAYQVVLDYIPESERDDLIDAYHQRLFDSDVQVQLSAARTFMKFDLICSTLLPNPKPIETWLKNDKLILGVAKAFCDYAKHDFYLKPNQILSEMDKIADLPAIIVQGRYDAICLPEMAYLVHKNWSNSMLWMLPDSGHSSRDPAMAKALVAATDLIIDKIEEK